MSESHYSRCKSSHSILKFASKTQRLQVGNGQYIGVLFIIPIVIDIHGHRFEIFTLVSGIHENVIYSLGIKHVFELDVHENHSVWNRSTPFFPKETDNIESKRATLYKDRGTLH